MKYIEIKLIIKPFSITNLEIVSAELAFIGFEGFYENDNFLFAYLPASKFSGNLLIDLIKKPAFKNISVDISQTLVEDRNWNQLWESSFEPVLIDNLCLIKAPFHNTTLKDGFELIIEPKMSFGTGHHATTQLMISDILKLDLTGKKVLDIGTGTGVLAILAAKKGAQNIKAVDNDEWASTNCMENVKNNNAEIIKTVFGSAASVTNQKFDVIFANINKPVILQEIESWVKMLVHDGVLLISGILETDEKDILNILPLELVVTNRSSLDTWLLLRLTKSLS